MRQSLNVIATVVALCMVQGSFAARSNAVDSSNTLTLITSAADRICTKAAEGGSSQSIEGSGSVNFVLKGLATRLAQAGVHLGYEQKNEVHSGVLAAQVIEAARDSNQCKTHVFDVLVSKLLPDATEQGKSGLSGDSPGGTTNNAKSGLPAPKLLPSAKHSASADRSTLNVPSSNNQASYGDNSPIVGTMTGGTINVGGK